VARAPLAWLVVFSLVLGCTAQKVSAPVEGEPLCPDFDIGASHAHMKGGLRKPIKVTVLDDGDPVSDRVLLGRRNADDAPARLSVKDGQTYDIEWAQCENERAPRPLKGDTSRRGDTASYDCGKAKPYAKSKLVVKRGDVASRSIPFVPPADAACWSDTVPEAGSGAPDASASAAPADTGAAPTASAPAGTSAEAPATAKSEDAKPAPVPSKPKG
jgi:hypothetical protein